MCCAVFATQSCRTLCDPTDCSPPGCSVHRDSPGKNTGMDCHALFQGIFPTQVFYIPGVFFTSKPPGKPKNTGVGSLSLLQGNFLTQELNQGLLHCRQILCQLSYQGSPCFHLYLVFILLWLITETIFLFNTWQSMKHYHIHLLLHLCSRKAPNQHLTDAEDLTLCYFLYPVPRN